MSGRPATYVVAVGSGKGGVGKSTVSLHRGLATLDGPARPQSDTFDLVAAKMVDALRGRAVA